VAGATAGLVEVVGFVDDGAVGLVTPEPIGFVGGFGNDTDDDDDDEIDEVAPRVGSAPLCAIDDPGGSYYPHSSKILSCSGSERKKKKKKKK